MLGYVLIILWMVAILGLGLLVGRGAGVVMQECTSTVARLLCILLLLPIILVIFPGLVMWTTPVVIDYVSTLDTLK